MDNGLKTALDALATQWGLTFQQLYTQMGDHLDNDDDEDEDEDDDDGDLCPNCKMTEYNCSCGCECTMGIASCSCGKVTPQPGFITESDAEDIAKDEFALFEYQQFRATQNTPAPPQQPQPAQPTGGFMAQSNNNQPNNPDGMSSNML